MHRMMSAIAFDMTQRGLDADGVTPLTTKAINREFKQHRVGIDSGMASQEGLVRLLVGKGVFTDEEYQEAMTVAMEREADRRYEPVRADDKELLASLEADPPAQANVPSRCCAIGGG